MKVHFNGGITMSLFNKVLASVGIGAAKVDTKLFNSQVIVGDQITGIVEIRGGNVEQEIADIYVSLITTYIRESDDKKYTKQGVIGQYRISEKFTISPNEVKEFPLSITVPIDTPISGGKTKIWIETGLDIKNSVDPSDKDYIDILPSKLMQEVLNAVQDLGFRLREVECEAAPSRLRAGLPFIQEFEFVAISGPFRGKLDELEIVFLQQQVNTLDIMMQIDRRARGIGSFLAERLSMDETNLRLTVTTGDLPNLNNKLFEIIQRYS